MIPRMGAEFVRHGGLAMSGDDIIEIVKAIDLMRRRGMEQDPRYATLLSVLSFVLQTTEESRRDDPSYSEQLAVVRERAQAQAKKRALETLKRVKKEQLDRQNQLQMIELQKMNPRHGIHDFFKELTRMRLEHNAISRKRIRAEQHKEAAAIQASRQQNVQYQEPFYSIAQPTKLFSPRQAAQLTLQLNAYQYLLASKEVPRQLRGQLSSFYDQDDWKTVVPKHIVEPLGWHVAGQDGRAAKPTGYETLEDPATALSQFLLSRYTHFSLTNKLVREEQERMWAAEERRARQDLLHLVSTFDSSDKAEYVADGADMNGTGKAKEEEEEEEEEDTSPQALAAAAAREAADVRAAEKLFGVDWGDELGDGGDEEEEEKNRDEVDDVDMAKLLKGSQVPLTLRHRFVSLSAARVQKQVRDEVLKMISRQRVERATYRNRRQVEAARRSREKQQKRMAARVERDQVRRRKNFLKEVLSHGREVMSNHRSIQSTCKRVSNDVKKMMDHVLREDELERKQLERDRLKALRSKDQTEYVRLLKQAKNERLLNLLKQTDTYMEALNKAIQAEHDKHDDGDPMASAAAEAAASAKDTPQVSDMLDRTMQMEEEIDETFNAQRKYYELAHKVKEVVTEQPKSLQGGTLREYQMAGLQWLVSLYNNRLNGILADEMGLGKTVQSVSLIAWLMEVKHEYGPFLFIVPMSTLRNNWEFEFDRWLPTAKRIVYDGDKHHRQHLRKHDLAAGDFNVVLTTYEFAMRDRKVLNKFKWRYIIIDEAHRLKNPKCKLAQDLVTYNHDSRRVALTGTPLQNSLPELWSLLNFLHPSIFNSVETFERWFSTPFDTLATASSASGQAQLEMTEEEKLLVIDRLHSIVRPFMLRREKREVETQLADKIERVLRCELLPVQRMLYDHIRNSGKTGFKTGLQNEMIQLRKICNHPYLFHPFLRNVPRAYEFTEDDALVRMCGKFALLDQLLYKLRHTGHRVLIFNQMTKTMDILEYFCNWRNYKFVRLDGNTAAEDRQAGLEMFNAPDSPYFIYMLSTKAGGLGLNLQSADTVILFDSDWNPQNDSQAQARAHRIGQKKQVVVLRLITTGTVEEKVLSTATNKLDAEAMVIKAGMFNRGYDADASRDLVADKLRNMGHHGEHVQAVNAVAVSDAISRSDEEREVLRKMDDDIFLKPDYFEPFGLDGKIPAWVVDFLERGKKADSCDQTLVPFDIGNLHQDLETKGSMVPTFEQTNRGRMRRPRTQVNYKGMSDREFNRMLAKGVDSDDEDGGDAAVVEDDDEDYQESEDDNDEDDDDSSVGGKRKQPASFVSMQPPPMGAMQSNVAFYKVPRTSAPNGPPGVTMAIPKTEGVMMAIAKEPVAEEDTRGLLHTAKPLALHVGPPRSSTTNGDNASPSPTSPALQDTD